MSPKLPATATVSVHVTMGSPSFVPGSVVTATITLRADRPKLALSRSAQPQPFLRLTHNSTHTIAASSTSLSNFGKEASARADYVACEVSGRWSSDRSWVVPHAHPPAREKALDNHLQEPITEHGHAYGREHKLPWTAALADANSIGGGGRAGHSGIIFRSQALVVCEREQIPMGSQVSFEVSCVLPDQLPPTLRGVAMRYTYALVVVVGFPGGGAPRVVRVPFRVVSAGGTLFDMERSTKVVPVPTPRDVGPVSNRFLEEREVRALSMSASLLKGAPPDDIEIALALSLNGRLTPYKSDEERQKMEDDLNDGALSFIRDLNFVNVGGEGEDGGNDGGKNVAPRRKNPIPVYGISLGGISIARLYLSKRVHHLGDTLSAIFHFTGEKPCYRLSAILEAQEVIRTEFAVGHRGSGNPVNGGESVMFRKVYGEHAEFVMCNRNTHVTFSIPHDASPSFATSVVSVRWLIDFTFLIPRDVRANGEKAHMVRSGGDVDDIEPLMDEFEISENGSGKEEVAGWEGGAWAGENPANWTHLPEKDVDVLRWTLPLVVSGQPRSQWGLKSSGKMEYTIS